MRKSITTSAISVVLLAANLCLAGYAPQQGQPKSETAPEQGASTQNENQSGVVQQQTPPVPMSAEEKLIRNAYVKLMRYHSAALDEAAAKTGRENRPEDYVTFEIRNVHTGPIEELGGKDLAELVTGSGGEVLKVTGHHLRYKHGPKHAFYDVEWAVPQGFAEEKPRAADESVRADLESGDKIETYSAYQVTVRLAGRERSYSAMAVFPSGWSITLGGRVKIQRYNKVLRGRDNRGFQESKQGANRLPHAVVGQF